jgi:oligopeptide/dipeptide ABC transporter ATP-binding protein
MAATGTATRAKCTLELRELTVKYGSGHDVLVAADRVSARIPAGGTLGLVGESGSGKSTVARAIVGLLPVASGQILLDGVDSTAHKARTASSYRQRVQMVFQDPFSSLNPRMTIGEAIGEALSMRGIARRERVAEARRVLELVGVRESALDRYPHQFSGGQRQRIAIARALSVRPAVIVLDEVTSALDVSVQATILNLLKELQRELGVSYLFISHDLSVVRVMSDEVGVMYLGRIVETASTDDLFSSPSHPYTRGLIGSVPRFDQARVRAPLAGDLPDPRNPPAGCRFHTRCPIGPLTHPERGICIDSDPDEIARDKPHRAACHFAGEAFITAPASVGGAG